MLNFSETTLFSVHPNAVYTLIDDEAVLMTAQDTLLGANPIATEIWKLLENQPSSFQSIQEYILERYDVDEPQCTSDLQAFMSTLLAEELIVSLD